LGWALLLAALGSTVLLWRRSVPVRCLAIVVLLFAWASFGNKVVWSTIPGSTIQIHLFPLWDLVNHLPIFNSVLPSRLALVVLPAVGLLIALGAAELGHRVAESWTQMRPLRVSAAALGIVAIIAAIVTIVPRPVESSERPSVPHFFTSDEWKA